MPSCAYPSPSFLEEDSVLSCRSANQQTTVVLQRKGRPLPTEQGFAGVFVASTTPFREDGSLDVPALRDQTEYLIDRGIDGIFASGTYGEGPLLGRDYGLYYRTLEEVTTNRIPVIAQVGSPDMSTVLELARLAEDVGMEAIAAVPPYYYSHGDEAILDYYVALGRSSRLPLFVYNNPFRTGNHVGTEVFKRLAESGTVVGIKDSGDNLVQFSHYAQVAPDGFNLLIGSDDLFLPGLLMGAVGAVVVVGGVVPDLVVSLYRAFRSGDYEVARKLQFRLLDVRRALKGPYVATYKEALTLLGRKGGYVRKPLRNLEPKEREHLRESLIAIGLLDARES